MKVNDLIPSNFKKQFHRCPRVTKWFNFVDFCSLMLQTISIYKNKKPNWFCTVFLLLWPYKRNLLSIAKWCYWNCIYPSYSNAEINQANLWIGVWKFKFCMAESDREFYRKCLLLPVLFLIKILRNQQMKLLCGV